MPRFSCKVSSLFVAVVHIPSRPGCELQQLRRGGSRFQESQSRIKSTRETTPPKTKIILTPPKKLIAWSPEILFIFKLWYIFKFHPWFSSLAQMKLQPGQFKAPVDFWPLRSSRLAPWERQTIAVGQQFGVQARH